MITRMVKGVYGRMVGIQLWGRHINIISYSKGFGPSAETSYVPAAFLKFTLACLDFLGPEALLKVAEKCGEIGEKG